MLSNHWDMHSYHASSNRKKAVFGLIQKPYTKNVNSLDWGLIEPLTFNGNC